MLFSRPYRVIFFTLVCLFVFSALPAKAGLVQDQAQTVSAAPQLTEEEMKQFLLTAKILKSSDTRYGVTRPKQLTLSDGKLTHAAGFQSVWIDKPVFVMNNGITELNFRDSYEFNLAAYELAKLLGLGAMMPVTVERKYEGNKGSLTWWLDSQMTERERVDKNIQPPDPDAWSKQFDIMMVFSELVYDADRNATNVLIGPKWELYMIDFTRSFRLQKDLADKTHLRRCSRQLLEKLRQLDVAEVERVAKRYLDKDRIKALIARRDKIVAYFDQQIKEKGESAIIF
jgi:hypothetical protein